MIKYNLLCECGETFESWFSSSTEFDSLRKKKFIKCIACESTSVKKSMMAPNLPSKSNKVSKKIKWPSMDFGRGPGAGPFFFCWTPEGSSPFFFRW